MSLTFKLRDGKISLPKNYFDRYLSFDWFLGALVRFDKDKDSDHDTYELWEDKNVVLSIFDSIKFQKLTVHQGVSLDYLENLCVMWLAPEWITEDIIERKKEVKVEELNFKKSLEKIHRCMNCSAGFKLSENHLTACKTHRIHMNPINRLFDCCGNGAEDPCSIGYHISTENDDENDN